MTSLAASVEQPLFSNIQSATWLRTSDATYQRRIKDVAFCGWSFLRANTDLVEWAVCLTFGGGKPEIAACMLDRLAGSDLEIVFAGEKHFRKKDDVLAEAHPRRNQIFINVDSWWIEVLGCLYGKNTSSPDERACACLQMAAILLHELGHLCGAQGWDAPAFLAGKCNWADIIAGLFMWAAAQRYPEIGSEYIHVYYDQDGNVDVVQVEQLPESDPTGDNWAVSLGRSCCRFLRNEKNFFRTVKGKESKGGSKGGLTIFGACECTGTRESYDPWVPPGPGEIPIGEFIPNPYSGIGDLPEMGPWEDAAF